MIYVIWGFEADENKNPIKAIKIGYTDNFEQRFAEHKVSHPTLEVLFKIEDGTREDEHSIHKYLEDYLLTHISSREWFQYCDEVIELFEKNQTIEDIRLVVPKVYSRSQSPFSRSEIKILASSILGLLGKNDYEEFKNLVDEIRNISLLSENHLKIYLSSVYGLEEEVISEVIKKIKLPEENLSEAAKNFINEYIKKTNVEKTLLFKAFCESLDDSTKAEVIDYIPYYCRYFYTRFGPKRCKSLGYNYASLEKACQIEDFDTYKIAEAIYSRFSVGERRTLEDIKRTLKEEYSKLDYKKTPKATDLKDWFEVKECLVDNQKGTKSRGYELLKRKGK